GCIHPKLLEAKSSRSPPYSALPMPSRGHRRTYDRDCRRGKSYRAALLTRRQKEPTENAERRDRVPWLRGYQTGIRCPAGRVPRWDSYHPVALQGAFLWPRVREHERAHDHCICIHTAFAKPPETSGCRAEPSWADRWVPEDRRGVRRSRHPSRRLPRPSEYGYDCPLL